MKTDLIYGVEDRPPFKEALFAALQHLLAIFVAIITPPLIIASALKLDVEKTGFLVSMSLFASGVSTFVQSLQKQIPAHELYRARSLFGLWIGFCFGKSRYEFAEC